EEAMPVFSAAVISDEALGDLATYVHESLGQPPPGPAAIGPRALDPFLVGVVGWFALAALVAGLSVLFSERAHGDDMASGSVAAVTKDDNAERREDPRGRAAEASPLAARHRRRARRDRIHGVGLFRVFRAHPPVPARAGASGDAPGRWARR